VRASLENAFEAIVSQKPGIGGVLVYSHPGFLLWADCACVAVGHPMLSSCFADHEVVPTRQGAGIIAQLARAASVGRTTLATQPPPRLQVASACT